MNTQTAASLIVHARSELRRVAAGAYRWASSRQATVAAAVQASCRRMNRHARTAFLEQATDLVDLEHRIERWETRPRHSLLSGL